MRGGKSYLLGTTEGGEDEDVVWISGHQRERVLEGQEEDEGSLHRGVGSMVSEKRLKSLAFIGRIHSIILD